MLPMCLQRPTCDLIKPQLARARRLGCVLPEAALCWQRRAVSCTLARAPQPLPVASVENTHAHWQSVSAGARGRLQAVLSPPSPAVQGFSRIALKRPKTTLPSRMSLNSLEARDPTHGVTCRTSAPPTWFEHGCPEFELRCALRSGILWHCGHCWHVWTMYVTLRTGWR